MDASFDKYAVVPEDFKFACTAHGIELPGNVTISPRLTNVAVYDDPTGTLVVQPCYVHASFPFCSKMYNGVALQPAAAVENLFDRIMQSKAFRDQVPL